jgi:tetratricopeptide (TPR) repeat protein
MVWIRHNNEENDNPMTDYQIIQAHAAAGNNAEAIRLLEELLRANPENAIAHNDLGVIYYKSGFKDKAFEHYQKAALLVPGNQTFQKNLADYYYMELGRTEDAIGIYRDILIDNPRDQETIMILANICIELGRLDDAKIFFESALLSDPDNIQIRQYLEKLEEIIQQDQAATLLDMQYREAGNLVAAGQYEQAITALEDLLRGADDHADSHNDLGVLYYNQGNKLKALFHHEKAAQLAPDNITFKKNLADLYFFELEKTDDAIRIYLEALKLQTDNIDTLLSLGHICAAINQPEEARIFFGRVLMLDPSNSYARERMEALP